MTSLRLLLPLLLLAALPTNAAADVPWIIRNGQSNAVIVIAEQAPRTTRLAANELQQALRKITGATLPIATEPGPGISIHVGDSPHTRKLGLTTEGLQHGAFRMISGENWLALLGDDTDFVPVEPWARSPSHWKTAKIREWDKLSGAHWRNPMASSLYKQYTGRPNRIDEESRADGDEEIQFWRYDRKGSLNAVYAWLRDLGMRWYMPGELGEVVPDLKSIELPRVDRTVRPDFPVRTMNFARYHSRSRENILWTVRLGENSVAAPMHHGLRNLTERPEQRAAHPDYFALINGRRNTSDKTANACLSSEGLFQENLRFVRLMFDHYDAPIVSVMPHDGFTQICECEKCAGKATRDRGYSGWYSDYVWEYVNRIAREVAKTHPDRKIMCGAYSTYQMPPQKIKQLEPNVLVQITNGRPRWEMDDEAHQRQADLRAQWKKLTPNPLSLTMNYPFTQRGEYRPCYFPHVIARGLRDTKGQVWRQELWLPEQKGSMHHPGVNHLNAWIHARLMWDADQDVDALLAGYYTDFYGPAAEPMKAFIEYCEANYAALNTDGKVIGQALDLFSAAQSAADPDSVYGRRIALVDTYLEQLRNRRQQLDQPRKDVPEFRPYRLDNSKWDVARREFKLDGKLDEKFWTLRGRLSDLVTGEKPEHPTRFQVLTSPDAIYIGIRCADQAGAPTNIATTRSGEPAIWNGDHVEILLETGSHNYYQIVTNPAAAVLDLDRGARKQHWYSWKSKTEVAAHVGEDFWSLEIRIPYTADTDDPLHLVVGERPAKSSLPWYFNICRKRIRGDKSEVSAFSPTGTNNFHVTRKFGKLHEK